MKKLLMLALVALFGLSMLGMTDSADAKRFGGGMSFGQQRMAPAQSSFSRQAMPQKQPMAGQRGAARPGFMGMVAGLAMGGLLGALLFGGGFEGINLFDILVIGGIVFLLVWLFRRKASPAPAYSGYSEPAAAPAWEAERPAEPVVRALRPEIDEKHFLGAARDIFVRMQAAWDKQDIDDIRRFCTADVAAKIEQDIQALGDRRAETEVGMLDATIADAWIESDLEWVAVDFKAMLREKELLADGSASEEVTHEVHESWIFRHDPGSEDPTWYLAGIQQGG